MQPLYLLLALALGFGLAYFLFKKNQSAGNLSDDFFNRFSQRFPEILNQANQNLVQMAKEKLGADKDAFEKLVDQVGQNLEKTQKKLELAENERIGNFNALKQSLEEHQKITKQLSTTTENLKQVLNNNQLRGAFGEKVADDLLKMAGFIKGVDYHFNKQQNNSDTRPDFCVMLPDGTKVNVDSKFPYSNLSKMIEADESDKDKYQKAFIQDVKQKIKQVCTKDYVDPEGKTVDFVILFIPNEMIFSFIYDKMPEVWEEAIRQKVVFAGPFSFTAILRMVRQAYDNFKYQKNAQEIIGYIKKFASEFNNYNQEFEKIGTKLDSLSQQYDKVNTTRTRQLLRVVDKIQLSQPEKEPKLIS